MYSFRCLSSTPKKPLEQQCPTPNPPPREEEVLLFLLQPLPFSWSIDGCAFLPLLFPERAIPRPRPLRGYGTPLPSLLLVLASSTTMKSCPPGRMQPPSRYQPSPSPHALPLPVHTKESGRRSSGGVAKYYAHQRGG